MKMTKGLKCENVLKFFEDICSIPHGSGNCSRIADYCVEFANEHKLECVRDNLNNVLIRKNASEGYEDAPIVILQGHLDMVCEKTEDKKIDFENEPITLMYRDGYLCADRTTLGGDDGIAIAMALAILDDDSLCHPEIEALFTVDEETDMNGAKGIDVNNVKGRLLFNIDSESEGVFTVSSAGTNIVKCTFDMHKESISGNVYSLKISGLCGGHSGVEIHKGRANAISLMGRALHRISQIADVRIAQINGGAKDNAIAVLCEAHFTFDAAYEKQIAEEIYILQSELTKEYNLVENGISLTFEKSRENPSCVFGLDCSSSLITFLYTMPNGVVAMSSEIEGLVKTSLNCGIIRTDSDAVSVSFLVRSSVESEMTCVTGRLIRLAEALGANGALLSESPAWEYRPDSMLREVFESTYQKMYGKAPVIEAIHAGLECGIFSKRIPGIDCISYGPDIHDIHTPLEKLSVDSVARVWEFTLEVLKNIK